MEDRNNLPASDSAAPARMEGAREPRQGGRGRFTGIRAPRVCVFCKEKVKHIDYKSVEHLRRYLTDRAKIKARRKIGTCAKHQRRLAIAIKRARHIALLPFTPGLHRLD